MVLRECNCICHYSQTWKLWLRVSNVVSVIFVYGINEHEGQ
jgi:hypothetical protein